MIKKALAIIIPIIVLAYPNAIEKICTKAADFIMMIITPAFEYMTQILK